MGRPTTTTSTSAAISFGGCDPDNDVVYMWILPHGTVITGALQIADGWLLTDWLTGWLTIWLTNWVPDGLTGWLTYWSVCLSDWMLVPLAHMTRIHHVVNSLRVGKTFAFNVRSVAENLVSRLGRILNICQHHTAAALCIASCHLAAHFSHLTHLRAFMKHFAALWQLLLHLLRLRACPTWTQCGNLIMTMCRANKLEKLRYTRSTPLRAVLHYAQ